MFKVSKQLYQSAWHDRIICKCHHCLPGGQNRMKKLFQQFQESLRCSRCLNNYIKVPNMIGWFTGGATASLVTKKGTRKLSLPFEDDFWCSRCLNNYIKVPDMIESFASCATASLMVKNGTKKLSQLFDNRFWCSRCLNNYIKVLNMMGSFVSGATTSLVVKMEPRNYVSHLKTDFDV